MATRSTKNLSIVGAGAVGTAFGLGLVKKGYKVLSVVSRSKKSAKSLAGRVGCKIFSDKLTAIHPDTTLLLITVPDASIAVVAGKISETCDLEFKNLKVVHTSGLLTSDALATLAEKGAGVFSLHPIQTFPSSRTVVNLQGVSFGFEGSSTLLRVAKQIVGDFGGELLRVPKEAKVLYHCACVIASNYPVVLLNIVDEIARRSLKPNSLRHFRTLTESSIRNAFESSPARALTGPVARGDVQTIQQHLRALLGEEKNLVSLYRTLGLFALRMIHPNKKISRPQIEELSSALTTEYEHLSF